MPQADMIFDISGRVLNAAGQPLANHSIKIQLGYHVYIDGVSEPAQPFVTMATDSNGHYLYVYPGPSNPLIAYDTAWGFNATVGNNQTGWSTKTAGQYSGNPQPPSPASIPVSDTTLKQP